MASHRDPHKNKSTSSRRERESAGSAWGWIVGLHYSLDLLNKIHVLGLLAHNVKEGLPDDVHVLEPLLELHGEQSGKSDVGSRQNLVAAAACRPRAGCGKEKTNLRHDEPLCD